MKYRRMPIEEESPEEFGYDRIRYNLTESSVRDRSLADLGADLGDMLLFYGDHAAEVPVDVDEFYRVLGEAHGAYVGPGHWFEQDRRHMRSGYAWPLPEELEGGLAAVSGSVRAAMTL